MKSCTCVLFCIFLVAAFFAAGCASMQQGKTYACPRCGARVSAADTMCPKCGQRFGAVAASNPANPGPSAGNPPPVAQHGSAAMERKFPPVKVGALFQATDSEHARFTPFVSVEIVNFKQAGEGQPIIFMDGGVAQNALFASVGVKGLVRGAPQFGFFLFVMVDWSPVPDETFGFVSDMKHESHIAVGIGVTLAEF
jgi:hypothetical protein